MKNELEKEIKQKIKNKIRRIMRRHIGWKLLFCGVTIVYMTPLLITFTNSFMSSGEVVRNYCVGVERASYRIRMSLIPDKVTLSQYGSLLFDSPVYLYMFWNSVKLALPIVAGQLAVSVTAAYAFTVLRFRGKELLFFLYIIVMLLPLQVTLMPNYLVADFLKIKESPLAIILPGIFQPFGVFLLRQYLKSMPEAYREAARIDGAGWGQIFVHIVLPMLKPAVAALVLLTLLDSWNLVDQPVVFIKVWEEQPLSVFLSRINEKEAGLAFAGSCFYAAPMLIALFYGQDHLRQGIAISGLK